MLHLFWGLKMGHYSICALMALINNMYIHLKFNIHLTHTSILQGLSHCSRHW